MPILGIMASQISGKLWAPAGAYDALATITVPSGGAATVTFSGIPTGYKHLQIRAIFRSSITNSSDNVAFQFNKDTAANYATHVVFGNGSSALAQAFTGNNYMYLPSMSASASDTSGVFGTSVVDILDYASTSKTKTVRALSGFDGNGATAYQRVGLSSSLWTKTPEAITSITFSNSGSFQQNTQFALYGVK